MTYYFWAMLKFILCLNLYLPLVEMNFIATFFMCCFLQMPFKKCLDFSAFGAIQSLTKRSLLEKQKTRNKILKIGGKEERCSSFKHSKGLKASN